MPLDADLFKNALRRWASGVTVVTSKNGDHVHGMTVSAFSSVSADPPLVMICANRNSLTHEVIAAGMVFAVNILAADQEDVSNRFASSKTESTRFDEVKWHHGETGAPVLDEALACLECTVRSAHAEGSHTIFVGQVEAVHFREGVGPLVYYDAAYRTIPGV